MGLAELEAERWQEESPALIYPTAGGGGMGNGAVGWGGGGGGGGASVSPCGAALGTPRVAGRAFPMK